MIGYKDRCWCVERDCISFGKDCDRALTSEVKLQAEKWWGSPGAPINVFGERPECFVKKSSYSDHK
jgi:hypothetical protein